MRYVCNALNSVLRGIIVLRCPLWPRGGTGPHPRAPMVAGQAKRGPKNVLVADTLEGPWNLRLHIVPGRTLRRLVDV